VADGAFKKRKKGEKPAWVLYATARVVKRGFQRLERIWNPEHRVAQKATLGWGRSFLFPKPTEKIKWEQTSVAQSVTKGGRRDPAKGPTHAPRKKTEWVK